MTNANKVTSMGLQSSIVSQGLLRQLAHFIVSCDTSARSPPSKDIGRAA
jgi:hypothetical protein